MGLVATLLAEGEAKGIAIGEARGKAIGEAKGEARGEAKGLRKGENLILSRLLKLRFGDLPEWAKARIGAAEPEQLEAWADRVLSASTLEETLAD